MFRPGTEQSRGSRQHSPFIGFGVNALTGSYLIAGMDQGRLAAAAVLEEAARKAEGLAYPSIDRLRIYRGGSERGWGDLDPHNLGETGWGVIFAAEEDPAVKEAVARLKEHRGGAAVFDYRPGETFVDWITRNGGRPGSGDPNRIPYYLCIVGGPERIPFSFQYGLDIEYAVGRLCFDQASDYDQYVRNLIDYEEAAMPNRRSAA